MHKSQLAAANAVNLVLSGRNLGLALEQTWARSGSLTPQQRAASQDLTYGALRLYGRYEALLKSLLQKPLTDETVHALLLVALYQLEDDRHSQFTVVDQAVNAAGQLKKSWAKGLVNAVLRNFLRQKDTLINQLDSEVAQYSYPQWWINKIRTQYPLEWESILTVGNIHPPMTLRVNRRKADTVSYLAELQSAGIAAQAISEEAIHLEHPTPVDRLPGFFEGEVSVQDFGAQHAAHLLDLQDGMRVLDACCAPGGKTGHALELANIEMTAVDSDASRIQRTKSNLERLGLNANLLVGDAAQPETWWDKQPFDRIIADVPCSASGIVRRHVDIKWLRREADIVGFSQQQAAILRGLWPLLKNGGKLLYVTCSIFLEENQLQINRFLEEYPDARQCPSAISQLIPCAQHDGFFYAILEKV